MPGDNTATDEEKILQTTADGRAPSTRRRTVLAGTAGFASVALAGCAGEEEPTEEPTGEPTEEPTEEPTPEPQNYVVTDEIIAGSEGIPEGAGGFAQSCSPQRQFIPGMQPVFDIGVWDPATGDAVGPDVIDEATVDIDGGPTLELEWDDEDQYWGDSWLIPEDQEAGSVSYEVQITNEGEYRRVGVLESEFDVIEFDDPKNYVVTDDLRTSSDGIPDDAQFVSSCGPSRAFVTGMTVIFDVGVYDGSTGDPVGTDVIDEATLTTDRGFSDELDWDEEDEYWQTTWDEIPDDEEPGTVTYEVEITNDGEFYNVGILESEFEIIE